MTVFLQLFWEYFKIGLFTIGGGYAMLPMVRQALIRNDWMTNEELANFIGIAESTPGPFAINLATFVGVTVGSQTSLGVFGGILGALITTFAVVLPSVVIIIVVTKLFYKFQSSVVVKGALFGIRPVVVGLVLSAVFSVGCQVVFPKLDLTDITADGLSDFRWISLLILAAFFPLSRLKIKGSRIHPIFLILGSAVVGILIYAVYPQFIE